MNVLGFFIIFNTFFHWKQLSDQGKALTNTGTAFLVGKTGKHKATSQKYHMR